MITKLKKEVYTTADGAEHGTFEAARGHLLAKLWSGDADNSPREMRGDTFAAWAEVNKEKLLEILKPGRKPRKPKPTAKAKKVEVKP